MALIHSRTLCSSMAPAIWEPLCLAARATVAVSCCWRVHARRKNAALCREGGSPRHLCQKFALENGQAWEASVWTATASCASLMHNFESHKRSNTALRPFTMASVLSERCVSALDNPTGRHLMLSMPQHKLLQQPWLRKVAPFVFFGPTTLAHHVLAARPRCARVLAAHKADVSSTIR